MSVFVYARLVYWERSRKKAMKWKQTNAKKTQIDYGMESGTRAEQQTYNIILKLRKMIRMYFYIVELCMQIEFRTWFDFVFVPTPSQSLSSSISILLTSGSVVDSQHCVCQFFRCQLFFFRCLLFSSHCTFVDLFFLFSLILVRLNESVWYPRRRYLAGRIAYTRKISTISFAMELFLCDGIWFH